MLEKRVKQRREAFQFYCDAFKNLEEVSLLQEPTGHFSNRWLTTILINSPSVSPEKIRLHLESCNIESRPLWKPMHLQPVFEGLPYYGDRLSDRLFEKGLCLPSGSNLGEDELTRIAKEVKKVFA